MESRSGRTRFSEVARRIAPSYQGVAPLAVGLLLALALLCTAFPHLHRTQSFPDLVAGYMAYWGGDKTQDTRAFLLLIGLATALPLAVAAIARFVAPLGYRSANGRAVGQLLLFSLVPAAWRLAVDAAQPSPRIPRFSLVSMFPLAALLGLLLLARYRRALRPTQILTVGGAVVLIVFLSNFVGYAIGVTFVRLIPPTSRLFAGHGGTLSRACMYASLAVLVALAVRTPTVEQFQARVLRCLQLMQYPLVLLLFHLVPPPFMDAQHRFNEAYPWLLVICLAACVGVAWMLMGRRFRQSGPADLPAIHRHPLARALAPAAVTAIVVFVYCGPPGWPAVHADDFHWGEQTLPWQQLVTFHKIPYVDFVPIHGLMAYFYGGFTAIFFDGTAATYPKSDVLLNGLAAAAVALATCLVVTPLGALLLLGGLLPDRDRTFFYVPALLALAAPQVVRRPIRLLVVWMVVGVLLLAYNPTQGPSYAVATLPVGLWGAWRAFQTRRRPFLILVAIVAAVAALVLSIPLTRQVCFAFVSFISENQYTNNVAHGIPWTDGKGYHAVGWGPSLTQFLWEATRSFWVIVAFICAALFWRHASGRRTGGLASAGGTTVRRNVPLLVLTGTVPIFLLVWSPWINGRLLPGIMNYPGDVSQTCLLWLIPVLVLLTVSYRRMATSLLLLAAISGFFYPVNPTRIDPAGLEGQAVDARWVPRDMPVVDGAALGLPRIGKVVPSPTFWYLRPIKGFLDRFLRPGETYLDLTNHTSLYFFLDLPYPVRYVPFVAANTRMQAGILKQLDEHPVPAVMIAPGIMIDMVSAGFRDYFIFRRYATRYSFYGEPTQNVNRFNEYAFLVDPARGARLDPPAAPVGSAAHMEGVDKCCYYMDDLRRLPASFGNSWSTLSHMFSPVVDLDPTTPYFTHDLTVAPPHACLPTGPDPCLEYFLPPQLASGQKADFLLAQFSYNAISPATQDQIDADTADPRLSVRWAGHDGVWCRSFTFDAPHGQLLIPLGAYPRWLLANDLTKIRFDLVRPERVRSFRLAKLSFLHLNDPPPAR